MKSWPGGERWAMLCRALGAAGAAERWYERLSAAYGEPGRRYHGQQHIGEVLREFDEASHLAQNPGLVELALWFHDAVYDARAADNEERSAELAQEFLRESGAPVELMQPVSRLIGLTKKHVFVPDADGQLMVDVDLTILGREERRFFEYEFQIRQEYAWVPEETFAAKRAEILQKFLGRERIFMTEWFRDKYERSARRNLTAALEILRHMPR